MDEYTISGKAIEEAVRELDALGGFDPEVDHLQADDILYDVLPPAVQEAYVRAKHRSGGWWYA